MGQEEQKNMKIENLVFKLNNLATQRQHVLDQLWQIEESATKYRIELVKLLTETCPPGKRDLHL